MRYPNIEKVLASGDRFDKQLSSNRGAPEAEVAAAAKVANSGWWLDRLIGIAKAIKSDLAPHLEHLAAIQNHVGHKPRGLEELGNELGGKLLFDMVMHRNWTREQLKQVAWGLPWDDLKMWDLLDLRAKDAEPGQR